MTAMTWEKPPLAVAVAGINYDQILSFEDLLPFIQDSLRPVFPGYVKENVDVTHSTKVAQVSYSQERHVFRTEDGRSAVIAGDQGMLVVTSSYNHFADFVEALLKPCLTALSASILSGPLLIRRYGLRYIDRVLPEGDETPEEYISDRLRHDLSDSIPGSLGEMLGLSLLRCRMSEGYLDIRCFTGLGRPPLPSDLVPSPVVDDKPLGVNDIRPDQRTAVIDTDRFMDISEGLDVQLAIKRYQRLHDDISSTFKATVTSHALKVWGCKNIEERSAKRRKQ